MCVCVTTYTPVLARVQYKIRSAVLKGAGAHFWHNNFLFNLFCICLLQTTYKLFIIFYEVYISKRKKLTFGSWLTDAQSLFDHPTFTTSCIYTLANSYQIWKMTSYQNLLIAYRFIFFKNTSFIYNWPPDTPIQCSPRLIFVCEQF